MTVIDTNIVELNEGRETFECLTGRFSDKVSYEDLSPREILDTLDAA